MKYTKVMKTLLFLSLLICFGHCENLSQDETAHSVPPKDIREHFEQFKIREGITLTEGEDLYRFKLFERSYHEVNNHNARTDRTFTKGLNKFAILNSVEFQMMYLNDGMLDQREGDPVVMMSSELAES